MYDRIKRLEMGQAPATTKRYTSDDAVRDKAELLAKIKLLERDHEALRKEIKTVRRYVLEKK
jgi:hypothetical protein